MQELSIDVSQYGEPEGIADNIRFSEGLSLPELNKMTDAHDGVWVIVGSGPSCYEYIDDIKEDQEKGHKICAVKGAYDYLRSQGITPDYYLSVEPRYRPVKSPSMESTFLLSTRVNKDVFKELINYPILLWRSWSNDDPDIKEDQLYIGGGTTSGLRAVNVGYVMGYRKFKFYGMDSCLGRRGEKRLNQEPLSEDVSKTEVVVGLRKFKCNMAMAAQSQDFQQIYDIMPDISIESAGYGLISEIIQQRKREGLRT